MNLNAGWLKLQLNSVSLLNFQIGAAHSQIVDSSENNSQVCKESSLVLVRFKAQISKLETMIDHMVLPDGKAFTAQMAKDFLKEVAKSLKNCYDRVSVVQGHLKLAEKPKKNDSDWMAAGVWSVIDLDWVAFILTGDSFSVGPCSCLCVGAA